MYKVAEMEFQCFSFPEIKKDNLGEKTINNNKNNNNKKNPKNM
jgi:hypothetical protein